MIVKPPNGNVTSSDNVAQALIAGLYARVSTGRQEAEATIESQIAEIKASIIADGNILPSENIFIDDGWTGEMLQRPQLDAMRDAVQAGKFQMLYVYDRGRLSRVFAYQEIIIEELLDKRIQFVSLHDVQAHTPEERVLQAMQGVFHEYERVKIAERMRRGKLYKAKSGILINGNSIYGYNYIKKTETTPAHYEINEEQSRVVKMIFNWVGNENVSLHEVIKRLYDMGILPRKQKSDFWTKGPIVRMLQCDSYIKGVVYYNKSEAVVAKNPIKQDKYKKVKRTSRRVRPLEEWIPFKVPVIIDDYALFEKVQKILESNQKLARKNRKYNYLLTGLIYCECGNRRAGDGSSKYGHFYYRCTERIYNFPLEKKCTSHGVNAAILDMMVWKELAKVMNDPALLKKYVKEWTSIQANNQLDEHEKNRLLEQMQKIKEEKTRYAKAYGTGTLEFDELQEFMKDAKKRELNYKKQLDSLQSKVSEEVIDADSEEFYNEVQRILKEYNFTDETNKIHIIRDIVDKVTIKERSEVEICAHLSLTTQKLGYEPIDRNRRLT